VQGDFTVPYLASSGNGLQSGTTCLGDTNLWAGIDGSDNFNLIQAGVDVMPVYDSSTGLCDEFATFPWYEVDPQNEPEQFFDPASDGSPCLSCVNPGDTMAVSITDVAGSWVISLSDETNGWSASVNVGAYDGPADSAEWILEAHTSTECGGTCTLAPFCTPQAGGCMEDDTYSGDQFEGDESTLEAVPMEQGDIPTAVLSAFDSVGDSFTVDYEGPWATGMRAGPLTHQMHYDPQARVTGPFWTR
jgi:Peptidase A4 family